jgi:hypothetical protein
LSSLSPAPSDDELEVPSDVDSKKAKKGGGILNYFSKASDLPPKEASPPPRKRSPSPPHEYVLADNPDIAVCLPCLQTFAALFLSFFWWLALFFWRWSRCVLSATRNFACPTS